MIKPTNIFISKQRGEDYFRLSYRTKGFWRISTAGFKTKKQLLKILKEDEHFEVDYEKPTPLGGKK